MSGSAPFLLYKEVSPTSNLRHSCFFRPVTRRNEDGSLGGGEYLFTAAVSAITIYEVIRGRESNSDIKLISTYHSSLYGRVQDVGVYRPRLSNSRSSYIREEYLVLSLDDGKFCLMRFDTNSLSLEPVIIYNSQENALGAGAIVKGSTHGHLQFGGVGLEPLVVVSDEFSLGCSVVYGSQIFLFPLTAGSTRADSSEKVGKDGNIPFLYDIYMSQDMPGNIIDICFLENYNRPTLAVLQATMDMTIGHAKSKRHTCTLTVLALDTTSRAASKLWQQSNLPHDSLRLLSTPKSPLFQHGNVLLVTMNALLIVSPDQVVGCATNGFAAFTVSSHIRMQTWPFDAGIELDGSKWLEAAPHELVGVLKDGRRFVVHITGVLDNKSSLDYLRFGFRFLKSGSSCSCCCANADGDLWFYGSSQERGTLEKVERTCDSLSTSEEEAIASLMLRADAASEKRAINAAQEAQKTENGAYKAKINSNDAALKKEELHEEEDAKEEDSDEDAPPAAKRARKAPAKKPPAKARKTARGKGKKDPVSEHKEVAESEHVDTAIGEASSSVTTSDPDIEELTLYGTTLRVAESSMIREGVAPMPHYSTYTVDTITVLGPVVTAEYTHTDDSFDAAGQYVPWENLNLPREKVPVGSAAAFVAEREVKDCLQLATGLGMDGSITRAAHGRRFVKVASKPLQKASDIFTVEMKLQPKPYSLMVLSFGDGSSDMESASRVLLVHESPRDYESDADLASVKAVMDLCMAEVNTSDDGDGFILDEITIGLLELAPNVVMQAVKGGLRIVRLDRDKDTGAGKGKVHGKAKGRGRSNSVGADSNESSGDGKDVRKKLDAASISADFYTLQEIKLDAALEDGGLGCAEGEYLVAADGIACPGTNVQSQPRNGESYLSLLTSGGSFFVLTYSIKNCLATITHRQIAQPSPEIEESPSKELDKESMDVDEENAELDTSQKPGAPSPTPPKFTSSGNFDSLLPDKSSRIMGASFYHGNFPFCDPVEALRSEGRKDQASTTMYGIKTPRKTPRNSISKTPGPGVEGTSVGTPHPAVPSSSTKERNSTALNRAKLEVEEDFLYGRSLGGNLESARRRSDSLISVDKDETSTTYAGPKKGEKKGRNVKSTKASKVKATAGELSLRHIEEVDALLQVGADNEELLHKTIEIPAATYLAIWTLDGALFVLEVASLECVFYCPELSLMPNAITVQRYESTPSSSSSPTMPYNEAHLDSARISVSGLNNRRLLHHVRICDIGSDANRSLCIIAIALTGDLFLYRYTGNRDATLFLTPRAERVEDPSSNLTSAPLVPVDSAATEFITKTLFSKVSHTMVTRRRRNKILYNTRKLKALLDAGQERAAAAQAEDARVDGLDLESLQYIRSTIVPDPAGGYSVVVSGGTLCSIQACGGLVQVAPVCLPEVHFMNAGAWAMAPLAVPSFDKYTTRETARGLCTLWIEHDADTVQAKSQRVGLLGLYQEAPGYFSINGSSLSFKRQIVGRTVHKTSEVTAKGDDKLEQELLSRRTSVYACSRLKSKAFSETKVTETDRLAALAIYDRYYPEMKSFLEPDAEVVGGAPDIICQSDSLVLVQEANPVSEYILPDDEQILDMQYCTLPVEKISQSTYFQASTRSGMVPQMTKKKVFVVVGTQIKDTHGEDSPGKGRLLLFGLDFNDFQTVEEKESIETRRKEEEARREQEKLEKERAGGDPADIPPLPVPVFPTNFTSKSTPKLKLHWAGPGAASIVQPFGDYVISAVDNTLFVYRLMPAEMELEQICFFEAKIYIKSVSVERNYVLISDFMHSVQLLVWSRDEYTLTLLGKDFNPCVGLSTSFLRDHSSMGLVVGDDEGNIQMLMYAPLRAESKDGARLLLQADFHLGCEASVMLQHAALHTTPASASATGQLAPAPEASTDLGEGVRAAFKERIRQRQAALQIAPFAARMNKRGKKDNVVVGTLEGAVGVLSALEEKTYRRLALLQQIMITSVRSTCALNPREFRLMKTAHFRGEKKRGVLDGSLLYHYVCLDGTMQDEIAAAMGVTADLLLDNLREIDQSAAVF